MLRSILVIFILAVLTSVASAEVYKWEDANGIHLTDSPASVPEKYREKVYAETREQIRTTTPQANVGVTQQYNPVATQVNQAAVYQANSEQQRRATEAFNKQQARALAASSKNFENALQPLARFMAIWLMIGFVVFIAWILTIVDIVRSEFTSPSNKTVWMLLVMFLPLLGMGLYYLFGLSQKCSSKCYKNKKQEELLARLRPRDPKQKDFVI